MTFDFKRKKIIIDKDKSNPKINERCKAYREGDEESLVGYGRTPGDAKQDLLEKEEKEFSTIYQR